MTAPLRLALDGGPPCLATTPVAQWPAVEPGHDLIAALGSGPADGIIPGSAQLVRRLERRWSDLVGRSYVIACRSSAAAARLSAMSLELGAGDEIVCPVDATAAAHAMASATEALPVFVDLDPQTLSIDPVAVEAAVTDATRAVLAVDNHGAPADHGALANVARRHGLLVVEDGSESVGATYDHQPVGSLGLAGFCGLGHPGPPAGPLGGAFFATDDPEVADNARRVLLVSDDLGLPVTGSPLGTGWGYRITEIDAMVADSYLNRLDYEVMVRAANGRHLCRRLQDVAGIWMPATPAAATTVHTSIPLLVQPDELGLPETAATALRDTLIDCTTAEGLWCDRSQPLAMASTAAVGSSMLGRHWLVPRRAEFPVADAMWASGLVLGGRRGGFDPLQSLATMDRIADCFTKILVDNVDRLRQLTIERMRVTP
ncbi:MAG: DegT/DnrJ/EryC1/StrS family aminotransferase [Acidimicrobiia bacterium]|nr:DegT/DnrJ/EryC1/StrS family aminotransferase [Acidimicrobiia bacterium]MDH4362922.1 DegT/DnrJ/EryC1/StrS family aminotransferase [Acidimicrobiia bacterium]